MSVVCIDGPEAERFAQAQFMNDVLALSVGQWQWNGWLTPKGRLIALFLLARLAEGQLRAVLLDYPATEFVPALQRMLFRAKAKVTVGDTPVAGQRQGAPGESGRLVTSAEGHPLSLGNGRALWLLESPVQSDAAAEAHWRDTDLAAGIPRLSPAQSGQWTPQMLGLERLHAFSVKKGCYPGQEIVARTHFLGQAKRGIKRVSADALDVSIRLAEGASVQDADGRDVGTIIAVDSQCQSGLAVVPVDLAHARVGGDPVSLKSFD